MGAKQLSDGNSDGTYLGQGTTDKIGFYGVTPVDQRSGEAIESFRGRPTGRKARSGGSSMRPIAEHSPTKSAIAW